MKQTVGDDVWIRGSATLCPGISIGDRSVIGAGSVVTKDIPSYAFAAGNPCRVIRKINKSSIVYQQLSASYNQTILHKTKNLI